MAGKDSRIPVWMTVGFGLGIGFAAIFLRSSEPVRPPTSAPRSPEGPGLPLRAAPNLPADATTLGEVEFQFRTWGGYALWQNNLTQFALWNAQTDRHSDFYEVRRVNRIYYFRTLPRENWPLLDHGEMARCPLWFAEPQEMRAAFYRDHPEAKPGRPVLRSVGPRAPLLPSVGPETDASDPTHDDPKPGPIPPGATRP
jgi:hypothetical protein